VAAERPERFFSLDVLRGLAALTVVFWHWQHFLQVSSRAGPPRAIGSPLFGTFALFYGAGWMAVDLFFALSGFVFFWLYAQAITERRISARDFFVLRFSRLYPLHLVTLLAVAVGQGVYRHLTGHSFVYVFNDGYHFLLNLALASSWGFERGLSFNSPVWSVSVEVALYAIFFTLCRLIRPRALVLLAISAVGFLVVTPRYPQIGFGIGGFFLGGCVFLAYQWIVRKGLDGMFARILAVPIGAVWLYALLPGSAARLGVAGWRSGNLGDYWPVVVLVFPLTILTLVLLETRRGTLGKRIAFIGNLSYASYLLQFPLQLAVATLAVYFGIGRATLFSPGFLFAFFALLVMASLASYRWFEAPAQRWIRGRLLRRRVQVQSDRAAMVGGRT
jgi:peptidoglycan/LPS O-acetylase OafA/YrhL